MDARNTTKRKVKIIFLLLTIPYEMLRQAMFQLQSEVFSQLREKEFTQPLLVVENLECQSGLSNRTSTSL